MGKVYNTTNYTDVSQHLKSKLSKNFVDDNYWIESYQNKIDRSWDFASNVADIEESIETFDNNILNAKVEYKPIEVRIMSAYDEKGKKLTDDYKQIVFKNHNHNLRLGRKYKFDLNNFVDPKEEDKSIWLNINFDKVNMGASAILRRCNGSIGFLVDNYTTEWYEPVIIENEYSYTNEDTNTVTKIAQDEMYMTLQYNEYTKNIEVSDRFIVGALNFEDITKNTVYKVKAVRRIGADNTFKNNSISIIKLALRLDSLNPELDLIKLDDNGVAHYIADYYNEKEQTGSTEKKEEDYYLKILPSEDTIYEGETMSYSCYLYNGENKVEDVFEYSFELPFTDNDASYFKVEKIDNNNFNITNLHRYFKSDLIITIKVSEQYSNFVEPLIFKVRLGEKL